MGRKSVAWRKDIAILRRLPQVERRHLMGESNVAIAAALGVDGGTVRNDIKRLGELWTERIAADQGSMRATMAAELLDVQNRALAAAEFDEECERAVLFDDPVSNALNFRPNRIHRDNKGAAQFRGNKAGALGQARQAIMDRAKLLGLVVEKKEVTGKDGEPLIKAYLGIDLDEV